MCQYQYHYYSQCKHQEIVLHRFCSKARPIEAAVEAEVEGRSDLDHDNDKSGNCDRTSLPDKTHGQDSPQPSVNIIAVPYPEENKSHRIFHDPSLNHHHSIPADQSFAGSPQISPSTSVWTDAEDKRGIESQGKKKIAKKKVCYDHEGLDEVDTDSQTEDQASLRVLGFIQSHRT